MKAPRTFLILAVVTAVVVLATPIAGSAAEMTFTGTVTAGATQWRSHPFTVTAGTRVTGVLDWTTTSADLNLYLQNPYGANVARARSTTARPEVITTTVPTAGTWRFGVKAMTGSSAYRLTVTTGTPPPTGRRLDDIAASVGIAATAESWTADAVDANGDGAEDLWIGYHDTGGKLWINDGDGTMSWVARDAWPWGGLSPSGQRIAIDRHGAAWGDVDGNGLIDMYATTGRTKSNNVKVAWRDNELWLQLAPGAFTDVGTEMGLADPYGRGRSAVLFDANGDGRLDLYVLNEIPRAGDTEGMQLGQNKFFLNVADPAAPHGFRFVSAPAWGLDQHFGYGTTALVLDQNADGLQDLLLTGRARLYLLRNSGDRFVDVSAQVGLPTFHVSDVALADIDGDARMDLVEVRTGALDWQRHLGATYGPRQQIRTLTNGWHIATGDAGGAPATDVYVQQAASGSNPVDFLLLHEPGGWVTVAAPSMGGRGSDVQAVHLRGPAAPVDFLVLNGDLNIAGPVMLVRLRNA